MTRLAEMFNVNHFIVSQVNPHVVPFLIKDEDNLDEEARRSTTSIVPGPTWFNSISHLAKSEALHRMHTLAEFGIFPNILTKTVSVLSQRYSGDITIFPEISYAHFPRMLSNPTPGFMRQAMLSGERATWPRLSIVKNHCAIELALDDAVQQLRTRVAFSPDEVELRTRVRRTSESRSGLRKRTKVRRPHSQASDPGRTILTTSTPSIHHNRSQTKASRMSPGLRHKKASSLNTVLADPARMKESPKEQLSNSDNLFRPVQDVTSSGADETANSTSSASSTSFSSPTDSPYPTDDENKWPRSFFGSSSQPATPSLWLPTSPSALHSAKSTYPALTMTPSKIPTNMEAGSFEAEYKRLFHPRPSESAASSLLGGKRDTTSPAHSRKDSPPAKSMKRNWALEIDIPAATRSLVSRSRRKDNKEG